MSAIFRLLKIEPGEGLKVLFFCLLNACLQAGIAIGIATSDSIFLSLVGVAQLPLIFLITPFLMGVYTPIYGALLKRLGMDRLFQGILVTLVFGGMLLFLTFTYGTGLPLAFSAKLYSVLWFIALYSLFWSFTEDYFAIQDAKRLYASFSGGGAVGAIIGGVLVSLLSQRFPVHTLFLVWSLLAGLTLPILRFIQGRWSRIPEESEPTLKTPGLVRLRDSRYVLWLSLTLFITMLLTTLCEYQYLDIFARNAEPAKLAALLGSLYALVNILNLGMNFLLYNRLVLRFGVGNLALVQNSVYLFSFVFMALLPGFPAAVLGYFAYQGILTSVDYNNYNLLINATPTETQKQLRSLLDGVLEPAGTAIMGLALLLILKRLSPPVLAEIGVVLSFMGLVSALFLRKTYPGAVAENLKKGWLDFSRVPPLIPSAEERLHLESQLACPSQRELALRLIAMSDQKGALDYVLGFLECLSPSDQLALRPTLEQMFEDRDSEVIRRILLWMERRPALHPALLESLASFRLLHPTQALLSQGKEETLGAATVAQLQSGKVKDALVAYATLDRMMGGSPQEIQTAIRVMGLSRQERNIHWLVPYLSEPQTRCLALEAMNRLATPDSTRVLPALFPCLQGEDDLERSLALEVIAQIADPDSLPQLFTVADGLSPAERRRFRRFLQELGLKSVPTVVSVVRAPHYSYTARSMAARSLGVLAPAQLEALLPELLQMEIHRANQLLADSRRLDAEGGIGVALLARRYRELQGRAVEFIIELLTIGGCIPDFELLIASLRSSNPKSCGNAIETIELGLPRPLFRQLLPLILKNLPASQKPLEEILATAFDGLDPIEASSAAFALWELGGEGQAMRLREKLLTSSSPLFRETGFALLADRKEGNRLETLYQLAQLPWLSDVGLDELEPITPHCEQASSREEKPGFVSLGNLRIPKFRLLESAQAHPKLAIALYRRTLE